MARTRASGFSLLEVLITLLVVSLGLLALAGMYSMLMKNSAIAAARSQAVLLAQEKLDRLRATTYTKLGRCQSSTPQSCPGSYPAACRDSISSDNAVFQRCWTTKEVTSPVQYTEAGVVVAWQDSSGDTQLATLATRLEPQQQAATSATGSTPEPGTTPLKPRPPTQPYPDQPLKPLPKPDPDQPLKPEPEPELPPKPVKPIKPQACTTILTITGAHKFASSGTITGGACYNTPSNGWKTTSWRCISHAYKGSALRIVIRGPGRHQSVFSAEADCQQQ